MTDGMTIKDSFSEKAYAPTKIISDSGALFQEESELRLLDQESSGFVWNLSNNWHNRVPTEVSPSLQEIFSVSCSRFSVPISNHHDKQYLRAAVADFTRIDEMAKEDSIPTPNEKVVANARALLPKLYEILPVRYHVSPTERCGVSIDAPMKRGRTVSVEFAPNDLVYCFVTIDGNSRRAKFYQIDGLPDPFIKKALRDFAGE